MDKKKVKIKISNPNDEIAKFRHVTIGFISNDDLAKTNFEIKNCSTGSRAKELQQNIQAEKVNSVSFNHIKAFNCLSSEISFQI